MGIVYPYFYLGGKKHQLRRQVVARTWQNLILFPFLGDSGRLSHWQMLPSINLGVGTEQADISNTLFFVWWSESGSGWCFCSSWDDEMMSWVAWVVDSQRQCHYPIRAMSSAGADRIAAGESRDHRDSFQVLQRTLQDSEVLLNKIWAFPPPYFYAGMPVKVPAKSASYGQEILGREGITF